MHTIVFSTQGQKDLKKLISHSVGMKKKIEKILHVLVENPNHPSLRLHKLKGQQVWSISVDMSIRMIIYFRGDRIYIVQVGTHNEVYLS